MTGSEVNKLMELDSRASIDENKTIDDLIVKLSVFDVSFHNLEASQVDTPDIIKGDNFSFVPFPCGAFVDLIMQSYMILNQDRSKKFIDVGCGIGTKVILACSLFDAYGIDYDESYVNKAINIGMKNRVGLCDALKFEKYDEFDLIYYYRPIHHLEKYEELEAKIHKDSKSGALIAPMFSNYDWDGKDDIQKVSNFLYRKV